MSKAKLKVGEMLSRVNGFSTPLGGVQWVATPSDREIVRKFLVFLEGKRVLYDPLRVEIRHHVDLSVEKIREASTDTINLLGESSAADLPVRTIRKVCATYMTLSSSGFLGINSYGRSSQWEESPEFYVALGELRSMLGMQIAILAATYEVELEADLEPILPPRITSHD